jgi:hypothetical protein
MNSRVLTKWPIVQNMPGNWRLMTGLPLLPALGLTLGSLVLPESPRWLLMKGDMDSALAVLHRVHDTRVRLFLLHAQPPLWPDVRDSVAVATLGRGVTHSGQSPPKLSYSVQKEALTIKQPW